MLGPGEDATRRAGFIMEMRARQVRDRRVLSALERVPRHLFVPSDLAEFAYADRQLPVACGQVIDRPSLAGRIVESLAIEPHHRVLEIGTGTGWMTAVLAQLAGEVITVERHRALAAAAHDALSSLGVQNTELRHADGLELAAFDPPFDRIYLGGSLAARPDEVLALLSQTGVLIAAIGPERSPQDLMRYAKAPIGTMETVIEQVRFVPLQRGRAAAL